MGSCSKATRAFGSSEETLSVTSYIGAGVEEFNGSIVQSAVNVPDTNQVRFTLNTGQTRLMFDYYYNQWATFEGVAAISSCIYHAMHTFLNSFGAVYQESVGSYIDGSNPVLMSLTSTWIFNLSGLQGYQRSYFFYLLGSIFLLTSCKSVCAYDYNPAPSQVGLIKPTNFSPVLGGPTPNPGDGTDSSSPLGQLSPYGGESNVLDWRVFLTRQRCQAFQLGIQEIFDPIPEFAIQTVETSGVGSALFIGNHSEIYFTSAFNPDWNTPWTLSFWVNVVSGNSFNIENLASTGTVVGVIGGGGITYIGIVGTGNLLVQCSSSPLIGAGWVNVTASVDGSGIASGANIYYNSVAQSLSIILDTLTGGTPGAGSFEVNGKGKLAQFGIYGARLTPTQVIEIVSAGPSGNLNSLTSASLLTHYYPLNMSSSQDAVGGINGIDQNMQYIPIETISETIVPFGPPIAPGAGLTLSGINLVYATKQKFRPQSARHSIGGGTV